MPQSKWTINNSGGGKDAPDIIGCKIKQTDTGYDFTLPDGTVKASTTAPAPPPSFSFPSFSLADGYTWIITVVSLSNPATGSWSNTDPTFQEEVGTWSAGSGEPEEAEEAAAAKAP